MRWRSLRFARRVLSAQLRRLTVQRERLLWMPVHWRRHTCGGYTAQEASEHRLCRNALWSIVSASCKPGPPHTWTLAEVESEHDTSQLSSRDFFEQPGSTHTHAHARAHTQTRTWRSSVAEISIILDASLALSQTQTGVNDPEQEIFCTRLPM